MKKGALAVEIEHWEAHLWHLMCGVWADKRCRICALSNNCRGVPEQWNIQPNRLPPPLPPEPMKLVAIIALSALLSACSLHHPTSVNYFVPPSCKPSVRLIDCDHASPPHCKKIAATYARNCEELSAR